MTTVTAGRFIVLSALLAGTVGYVLTSHENALPGVDPDLGQLAPIKTTVTDQTLIAPVELGSLERCGCKLTDATNYRQPDGCRLKVKPNLLGVAGYLKTGDREVDKRPPPWRIRELKQTGPEKWDGFLGRRTARSPVRVTDVQLEGSYTPLKGRLQVQVTDKGVNSGQAFWVSLQDFDPVPWWQCSADKAVEHSAIIARPKPGVRPVTLEGRWITKAAPERLWCWTWVSGKGVYCDPVGRKDGGSFEPWIYQPGDLEIVY
ncbi:hypothetical protein [Methylobacterium sp. 275MFSha3.1]|uniref:hypothetical protein n=1 Tax=Methylobacterium sp. 275MFSha3.1 TaxID=1502746 RepID=UPI001115250F|nr:hypothetical protein [Methylobacterium sp. 275MFSha3.1]